MNIVMVIFVIADRVFMLAIGMSITTMTLWWQWLCYGHCAGYNNGFAWMVVIVVDCSGR
jgi:hypothetical protein